MRKLFVVFGIITVLFIGGAIYVLTARGSGNCCGDPCEQEQCGM